MEVLSLHFTYEKIYEWEIHKNVKTTSKGEDRICAAFITTSKELRINAQTGKTLKKRSKYTRSVRWY